VSEIDTFAQGLAEMSPEPQEAPVQAVETQQPAPVEQPPEPAQPAPAAEPAQPVEPQQGKTEQGHVPLAAMLDERDRRRKAEAELQQYRQQSQPQVQPPSAWDDPDGFAAYQSQQFEERLLVQKLEMSESIARTVHGEAVDPAKQWAIEQANTVPGFAQQWIGQANPIDWAVRQHRQTQLISQLGDAPDLDKAFEKWAAERGFVKAGAAPAAPLQPTVSAPSRSVASAPSAGGPQTVPTGPLASFDSVFAGK
jgi:hypothetical protein